MPCGINGKRTWLERRNLRSNGSGPRVDGLTQHGYPMGRQDHLRDLHKSIGEAGTFSATLAVPIRCAVLTDGGNRKDRCHTRPSIQLSRRGRCAEPTVHRSGFSHYDQCIAGGLRLIPDGPALKALPLI